MNRHGAPGVDGVRMTTYGQHLEDRLADLVARLKRGAYRAPPVRRTHIPKAGHPAKLRPVGIPTVEDRRRPAAVARVLGAIYEPVFPGQLLRVSAGAERARRVATRAPGGSGRAGPVRL